MASSHDAPASGSSPSEKQKDAPDAQGSNSQPRTEQELSQVSIFVNLRPSTSISVRQSLPRLLSSHPSHPIQLMSYILPPHACILSCPIRTNQYNPRYLSKYLGRCVVRTRAYTPVPVRLVPYQPLHDSTRTFFTHAPGIVFPSHLHRFTQHTQVVRLPGCPTPRSSAPRARLLRQDSMVH